MNPSTDTLADSSDRCRFIGGSDARIIMGQDEAALVPLGEARRAEAEDPSGNLAVFIQALNRPVLTRVIP
jgi:hypothetical protein